jgi:ubiquinone/menaquinone biosynthesis C-methylase UbiE
MNTEANSAWHDYGRSGPEIYERHMVPAIFGPWAEDLVKLAAPKRGDRILDVACGTGIVARTASQHVGAIGKVVGLDLNAGMLTVARSASARMGNIEWREGNAMAVPFSDRTFDLVFCQQGLQFIPNRLASSKEMHRVLVPEGKLALSVWTSINNCPGFKSLAEALANHISSDAATFMQSPFSLASENELRHLVEEAGFQNVKIHSASKDLIFPSPDEFARSYVAASPLAAMVAKAEKKSQEALFENVNESLRPFVKANGLVFPIETRFALARA